MTDLGRVASAFTTQSSIPFASSYFQKRIPDDMNIYPKANELDLDCKHGNKLIRVSQIFHVSHALSRLKDQLMTSSFIGNCGPLLSSFVRMDA